MAGFKSQTKRRRELAKLDKRKAKDEKRAQRKAERSASAAPVSGAVAPVAPVTAAAPARPPIPNRHAAPPAAVPGKKPLTLAEAVERWKATKVVKAKPRW